MNNKFLEVTIRTLNDLLTEEKELMAKLDEVRAGIDALQEEIAERMKGGGRA